MSALLIVAGVAVATIEPAAAARRTAEDLVPGRINPTGRVINMPVPFKEKGGAGLGEITLKLNPNDTVEIPKAQLTSKLGKVVTKATLTRIAGLPDRGGFVGVMALRNAGIDVRFDAGALELIFIPTVDQRPPGSISFGRRERIVSPNLEDPAYFSGYINLQAGADYIWKGTGTKDGVDALRFDVEAVLRMGNVVLENEFTYEEGGDTDVCPTYAICTGGHFGGVKRRGTRFVYDLPRDMLRIRVGDTDTLVTGFQRSVDVLGVSIEKSPRKLAPGANIRPTGQSSFRIERPSEVQVLVNGAIVRKLNLRPGNYNVSDLPLRVGANDIELIITDDVGETRRLRFSTFSGTNVLKPGMSIWAITAGMPSYRDDNAVAYRKNEWFASGFLKYGVTDWFTAKAHAQADDYVAMAGAGALLQSPFGYFALKPAFSHSDAGTGFAFDFDWSLINFAGITGRRESFRFSADYRSEHFRTPGEYSVTANGFYYPIYDYWLRLNASYSLPLDYGITATLAGRYAFIDDNRVSLTGHKVEGDRYGLDLTLSAPLSRTASGSFTVGYSNERYAQVGTTRDNDGDFRFGFRIYWRPDRDTRIATSYDTLNNRSYASATRTFGRGVGRWETSVDVQHDDRAERAAAGAAVGYYGNRFEARVSHTSGFNGVSYDGFDVSNADQRTRLRFGTAVAFADGLFGIGAPIRSGGFAVVKRHSSLAGKRVAIGTTKHVRAVADGWGPAVVSSLPNYSQATIPYDVDNLPLGYSLGTSAFDVFAPYRAGYALTVGSPYSVSVFGTLLGRDGQPISLLTGTARPAGNESGKAVTVFTNRSGKFGADGLSPGRWVLEMATDGAPTRFAINIPDGTEGLFRAGTLRPVR